MILSIETCVQALNAATINRRAALLLEMSVGLAVFLQHGNTSLDAKRALTAAYASSGYDCLTLSGIDYKTVNRRINTMAAFYETVNVRKWVGKLDESDALRAIYLALEPYEFHTISDVQRKALPPPAPSSKPLTHVKADHAALSPTGTNRTGQERIRHMFRRAADQKDARHIDTEHLHLVVPRDATREELIQAAQKILDLAQELLTA